MHDDRIVDPVTKAKLLDELMASYQKLLNTVNGFTAIEALQSFMDAVKLTKARNDKYKTM